jgi:2-phospho-L-lactate guanylyltransferase
MPASATVWSVVVPVKVLISAKTRLAGLSRGDRAALALAMAADTVAAALSCPAVGAVVVVTDDSGARSRCRELGADVIADEQVGGLNPALIRGAAHAAGRWPGRALAGLVADVPALRPAELATALAAASRAGQAFVADAAGSGSTLYAAAPGAAFRPRFGGRSRERHLRYGAAEIMLPREAGLRRDVDTLADLRVAAALGLGPRSAALAATLTVLAS